MTSPVRGRRTSHTGVLVVGAGPVGLALACELARRSVDVRIIDKLAEPTSQSRAVVVHARTLEGMERIGVADAVVAAGQRTTAMRIYGGGRPLAHVELGTVDSPFPFTLSLPQDETERILTARLADLGVTVERPAELTRLEQDATCVRASFASGETVECDFVAGTDGSHSVVRGEVGLRLEGAFQEETFLLGDVTADHDLDPSAMHAFFSPDAAPLLVFPMGGRRIRIVAPIDDDTPEPALDGLQQLVNDRTPGFRLLSSRWITPFEIHRAQVPRYRAGRVFLAGDAAHLHSPAGGQGMNTGIQDALNLGWKLARAASSAGASATLLDSYHGERHPVAARVISVTSAITHAGTVANPLLRRARNSTVRVLGGLTPVAHRLAEAMEETRVAYRDSPIVIGAPGDPRPGDAAPDVLGLHRELARCSGHTALHIAPATGRTPRPLSGDPVERTVLVAPTAAGHPASGFDTVVADPSRAIAHRYGTNDAGGVVVIRPDGYIALRDAPLAEYQARLRR